MALAEREIAPPTPTRFYTEAEYLALEDVAEFKSEYVDGEIRPMSGGTEDHAVIPANMLATLWNALRGRSCRLMTSDMKVWAAGAMFYPDITVVCGPSQYRSRSRTVITNPVAVIEVLSPGTADKDRGEKFLRYQQIDTLMSYILVSQDAPRVEVYTRGENGHWDYETFSGLGNAVALPALSVTLALSDIFDQIDFDGSGGN